MVNGVNYKRDNSTQSTTNSELARIQCRLLAGIHNKQVAHKRVSVYKTTQRDAKVILSITSSEWPFPLGINALQVFV